MKDHHYSAVILGIAGLKLLLAGILMLAGAGCAVLRTEQGCEVTLYSKKF